MTALERQFLSDKASGVIEADMGWAEYKLKSDYYGNSDWRWERLVPLVPSPLALHMAGEWYMDQNIAPFIADWRHIHRGTEPNGGCE